MEKAAAYIRVSTDDQCEYSPNAQLQDILEFAERAKIIIDPKFIFIDEGISGKKAETRPAFMEMLKVVRNKTNGISMIIVHKFDRFSRKKDDAVLYKAILKKDGIKVISVKEPIPDDDKFAVIYESMLEAMAEYYSLNLAEEVKKTMLRKAERGEYQSAAPFGYKNNNKSLEIIPEESEIVKIIFNDFTYKYKSMKELSLYINRLGYRTHRGNVFESRTIQYILYNPVYKGYVRWTPQGRIRRDFSNPNSIIRKSTHIPIIDEETWDNAQKRLAAIKKSHTPHTRPMPDGFHWISGMVKCSHCGRSLIVSNKLKDGNFALQCGGYNHGQCHISHYVTANKIIPSILDALYAVAQSTESQYLITATHISPSAADTTEIYNRQLSKIKLRLEKSKDAYLLGIDSIDEYKITKKNAENEMNLVYEKIKAETISLNLSEYSIKIKSVYDTLISDTDMTNMTDMTDMNEKKIAIRSIVEKIVYTKNPESIELFIFDP